LTYHRCPLPSNSCALIRIITIGDQIANTDAGAPELQFVRCESPCGNGVFMGIQILIAVYSHCARIISSLNTDRDMAGKQAKILSLEAIEDLLFFAETTRHPNRDRVVVLLSFKAGLRAAEIANLTWQMVETAEGHVGTTLELWDNAAKRRHGRRIPLQADLREALENLHGQTKGSGPVIRSERGGPMRPLSIVIWFTRAFAATGLDGCSSHSGRRTFITRAARLVHKAGGSLRDVQLLAGHRSIQTTQRYIDGDSDAQRKLISLI
jgi:integrase